jgi:hypothetical protein
MFWNDRQLLASTPALSKSTRLGFDLGNVHAAVLCWRERQRYQGSLGNKNFNFRFPPFLFQPLTDCLVLQDKERIR